MKISCDCSNFRAELTAFPKNTPGRLLCYCKDCQSFAEKIGRQDILDVYGGTEIVPVYPGEIRFLSGDSHLQCCRLTSGGPYRWFTSCCNSPIVNTKPGFPWAGVFHNAYTRENPDCLNQLGDVRARIFGRDALPEAPFRISEKVTLSDMLVVMPFIVRGKILRKAQNSPFFKQDNATPVREPVDV